jgi:hypothetical protein
MSRTTSIAGVRPLGWLARVRAHRKCLAWACPVQLLGAAGLAPITALGMGARDDHARQRSGPGQGWCIRKSEKLLETGRGSESAAAHGALRSGRSHSLRCAFTAELPKRFTHLHLSVLQGPDLDAGWVPIGTLNLNKSRREFAQTRHNSAAAEVCLGGS